MRERERVRWQSSVLSLANRGSRRQWREHKDYKLSYSLKSGERADTRTGMRHGAALERQHLTNKRLIGVGRLRAAFRITSPLTRTAARCRQDGNEKRVARAASISPRHQGERGGEKRRERRSILEKAKRSI